MLLFQFLHSIHRTSNTPCLQNMCRSFHFHVQTLSSSPFSSNGSLIFGGGPKKGKRSDGVPSSPTVDTIISRTFCFNEDFNFCSYSHEWSRDRVVYDYASLICESDILNVRVNCRWSFVSSGFLPPKILKALTSPNLVIRLCIHTPLLSGLAILRSTSLSSHSARSLSYAWVNSNHPLESCGMPSALGL